MLKYIKSAAIVPLITPTVTMISLLSCYILYKKERHDEDADSAFPTLSNIGIRIPERGIFSMALNFAALGTNIGVFLRNRMLSIYFNEIRNTTKLKHLAKINAAVGYISCLGYYMLGNFQADGSTFMIHRVAAWIAGGCGFFYTMLDSYISYRICNVYTGRSVMWTRIIISVITLISGIGFQCVQAYAFYQDNGTLDFIWKTRKRVSFWHGPSHVLEWICEISLSTYCLTYVPELAILHVLVATKIDYSQLKNSIWTESTEKETLIDKENNNHMEIEKEYIY